MKETMNEIWKDKDGRKRKRIGMHLDSLEEKKREDIIENIRAHLICLLKLIPVCIIIVPWSLILPTLIVFAGLKYFILHYLIFFCLGQEWIWLKWH